MPDDPKQIFASPDDRYYSASLHAADKLHLYAYGYRRAVDLLIEHVATTHTSLDVLVYPVVYLYRHHIELLLKIIIRDASALLHDGPPHSRGHNLERLWETAKSLLRQVETAEAVDALEEVDRVLNALGELDPRSTTFRYPEELDGSEPLASLSHINYRRLHDALDPLCDLLDGICTMLDQYLQAAAESEADY